MVDEVLKQLSPRFDTMYTEVGRPSSPPEQLLRAGLLQMFYSVRNERLLMEEIDYKLLLRWFVRLNADDKVCDPTVFPKNRDRLLEAEVAKLFPAQAVAQVPARGLTSDDHFSVDGTLLEAWPARRVFQPRDKKNSPPLDIRAIPQWISAARSARAGRTSRSLVPTLCWCAVARARRRN